MGEDNLFRVNLLAMADTTSTKPFSFFLFDFVSCRRIRAFVYDTAFDMITSTQIANSNNSESVSRANECFSLENVFDGRTAFKFVLL